MSDPKAINWAAELAALDGADSAATERRAALCALLPPMTLARVKVYLLDEEDRCKGLLSCARIAAKVLWSAEAGMVADATGLDCLRALPVPVVRSVLAVALDEIEGVSR